MFRPALLGGGVLPGGNPVLPSDPTGQSPACPSSLGQSRSGPCHARPSPSECSHCSCGRCPGRGQDDRGAFTQRGPLASVAGPPQLPPGDRPVAGSRRHIPLGSRYIHSVRFGGTAAAGRPQSDHPACSSSTHSRSSAGDSPGRLSDRASGVGLASHAGRLSTRGAPGRDEQHSFPLGLPPCVSAKFAARDGWFADPRFRLARGGNGRHAHRHPPFSDGPDGTTPFFRERFFRARGIGLSRWGSDRAVLDTRRNAAGGCGGRSAIPRREAAPFFWSGRAPASGRPARGAFADGPRACRPAVARACAHGSTRTISAANQPFRGSGRVDGRRVASGCPARQFTVACSPRQSGRNEGVC